MDKNKPDEIAQTLSELKDMISKKEMIVFTPAQAERLVELAEFWDSMKAVISFGSAVGGGLKWFLMFFATWAAFKAGVLEWLKAALSQAK